jgi:tetratricopeptide (TPR) repeat protein
MMDRHPEGETLERYLDGALPEGESRALQRHLFLCPICEDRMIALLPGSTASPQPAAPSQGYRGLIHRLLSGCRTEIASRGGDLSDERLAAAELWRQLEPQPNERRRAMIQEDVRFQSWGFFEVLVERSRRAVLDDPRRAEYILRLALDVAELLRTDEYGPGSNEAAKSRAWAWLGNAWRILGDFRQAEMAFQTAELYLSQSWFDPLDEALLMELKAPLRRAQRRFDEALELLAEAIAIYREVNEPHLQGRALVVKGLVLRYQGEPEGAADCFRSSLPLLDGTREPRLLMASQYNFIGCLKDSGRIAEAAALIPEARKLIEQAGTRSDLMRLRWTEGRVALALGQLAEAEEALLEVRESFIDEGRAFDAAQAALDLAALYLQQRRLEETKILAAELVSIFQAREIDHEALAALILFQTAAEMESLNLGLVEEVAAYLQDARANPHIKFREKAPAPRE